MPFSGRNNGEVFRSIKEDHLHFKSSLWLNVSENCKIVIRGLLHKDPKKRMTLNEAICSPWLNPIERSLYEDGITNITKYRADLIKNFRTTSTFQKEMINYRYTKRYSTKVEIIFF